MGQFKKIPRLESLRTRAIPTSLDIFGPKQQYFPQSIYHGNVHSLLTHISLLRIWRYCN